MSVTTRQTKSAQVIRHIDFMATTDGLCVGVVTEIAQLKRVTNAKTTVYHLRRIESQIGGTAVEVAKQGDEPETYHVRLDSTQATCDFPAGTYRGTCRHLDLVHKALKQKRI
jgi:hypothetical protein